jgi:hypothetical protein
MNYFAHGLPHVDRPYFLAGTALPDWLSVVDRKVRLRARNLSPHLVSADPIAADLAAGAMRHLDDDGWFHTTRAFAEVSGELTALFREKLNGGDGFWCGFLGHVALELLLDAVLFERYPQRLDDYYAALAQVDSAVVEDCIAAIAGRRPERLGWFIRLFRREEILRDYADDARLAARLNQVLCRVKLTPLPDAAAGWLAPARDRVRERIDDLLPEHQFAWPREAHGLRPVGFC